MTSSFDKQHHKHLDCIKNDIELAYSLLAIGIMKVTDDRYAYEAIIMRATLTLLEMLCRNVDKQMVGGAANG